MLSCLSLAAAAAVGGMCPPVHCLILPTWQDAWTAEQSFWPQGHDPPSEGALVLSSTLFALSSSSFGVQPAGIMEGSLLAGEYCKKMFGQEDIRPPGGFPQRQTRRPPAVSRSLLFAGEEGCRCAGDELPGGTHVALLHNQTRGQLRVQEDTSVPR